MAEYIVDIDSKITVNLGAMRLNMTGKAIQGARVDEEIIRCRDCKWYAEVPCELDVSNILYTCTRADFCMPSGGNCFCSWAERDDQ